MHQWGDEDFRWDRLDKAIRYIDDNLVRWGRINVRQSKEKFGEARVYCSIGYVWGLYGLVKPRAIYYRWGQWLKWTAYTQSITQLLSWALAPWQRFVYREVYKRAVAKYPDMAKEILGPADYGELLKGLMPDSYYYHCRVCEGRSAFMVHRHNHYVHWNCEDRSKDD